MSDSDKSSSLGTFFNIFMTFVGSGLLALPSGVKNAGLVGGVAGIFAFYALNNHTALLIIKCKYLVLNRSGGYQTNAESYQGMRRASSFDSQSAESALLPNRGVQVKSLVDICGAAFGGPGRAVMNLALFTGQIGFSCVYVIYVTRTVQEASVFGAALYPGNATNFAALASTAPVEMNNWVANATFIWLLLLLASLPSLKFLAPTSMFGNVSLMVSVGLILSVGLVSPTVQAGIDLSTLPLFKLHTFPVFFGIVGFAYSVHGVVINFESEMAKPEQFGTVLSAAIFLVMLLYQCVGPLCYIYFGEDTKGAITDNLDGVPEIAPVLVLLVKLCLSISLCCTYPIQLTPVVKIMEQKLLGRRPRGLAHVALRCSVVLFTCVLAQTVPFFGLFASLVGGCSASLMNLIMPPLCYLKLAWVQLSTPQKLLNALCVLIGATVVVVSTVVTSISLAGCFQDRTQLQCL